MGQLAHPTPPNPNAAALTLTDRLIEVMGDTAFCVWLADTLTGRGNWTDTAPLAEIAQMLTEKLTAVKADLDTCLACGCNFHVNTQGARLCLNEICLQYRQPVVDARIL